MLFSDAKNSLSAIADSVHSIDLNVHKHYTVKQLQHVRNRIEEKLQEAEARYKKECLSSDHPNKEIYKELNRVFEKKDSTNYLQDLFNAYNNLTYSFMSARFETKNLVSDERFKANGAACFILLCKNVRILEDVIGKICMYNVDKSIIDGEQQFDSMQLAFEWLFCQDDTTAISADEKEEQRRIDIRDSNRYLDYLKYQMMVSSKRNHVENSVRSSTDIDNLFSQIQTVFWSKNHKERMLQINAFKDKTKALIKTFFEVYQLLITYRSLRFQEEEMRRAVESDRAEPPNSIESGGVVGNINLAIVNLSSVAVRVLLDRFVSFVKIGELNFGNSTFKCAWFNYSELSKSNYAGSNFKYARIENARMTDCDISTCNLTLADGSNTDFSGSNFTYSDLSGISFVGAILNKCSFQNSIFTDSAISSYKMAIKQIVEAPRKEETNKQRNAKKDVANERFNAALKIWDSVMALNSSKPDLPIKKLQQSINNLEPEEDINLKADNPTISAEEILKYPFYKLNISNESVFAVSEEINKQMLRSFISLEQIAYIREMLHTEPDDTRNDRIKAHGTAYFDAADLSKVSAKEARMGGLLLNRVKLEGATFENTDLSGATMYYNAAKSVSYISANLNNVECFESDFYLASFAKAAASNASFINSSMQYTNWSKAIIINTLFADFSPFVDSFFASALNLPRQNDVVLKLRTNASPIAPTIERNGNKGKGRREEEAAKKLSEREQENEKLNNQYWQSNCSLDYSTFTEALADRSLFINISADRSTFDKASMKSTYWFNSQAEESDFIDVDFRYSKVLFCKLNQANLTRANLASSLLKHIDFSDSNLYGALFNNCTMSNIVFAGTDTRNTNFSSVYIKNSLFKNCKLTNAILADAVFENCVFENVDLNGIIGYRSSKFNNCYFRGSKIQQGKDLTPIPDGFRTSLHEEYPTIDRRMH